MEVSFETLRKLLLGMKGDKRLRRWGTDWLQFHIDEYERNERIETLAREWLYNYVTEVEELPKSQPGVVNGQIDFHLANIHFLWDNFERRAILDPRAPLPFDQEKVTEMLMYVNDQFTE